MPRLPFCLRSSHRRPVPPARCVTHASTSSTLCISSKHHAVERVPFGKPDPTLLDRLLDIRGICQWQNLPLVWSSWCQPPRLRVFASLVLEASETLAAGCSKSAAQFQICVCCMCADVIYLYNLIQLLYMCLYTQLDNHQLTVATVVDVTSRIVSVSQRM